MIFVHLLILAIGCLFFICILCLGAYLSSRIDFTATATVVPVENALELSHDSDRSFIEAFENPTINEVEVIQDY